MGHSIFKADYPLMQRWLNRRGYRGSINDMFDKYFKTLLGGGTGTVNNLAHTYFGSLGYTGDTGERLNSFFTRVMGINNPIEAQRAFFASDSTGFDIGAPSFEADFSTGFFDKRITFSRTTNATRMKSNGLLGFDPHNFLIYSEEIDNAAWVKAAGLVVTANVATAPNGTMTADSIQDPIGDGTLRTIYQGKAVVPPNSTMTASIYVKKEVTETNYGGMRLAFFNVTTKQCYVAINAVTGQTATLIDDINANVVVTDVGDYWRLSVGGTDTGSNTGAYLYYFGVMSLNFTSISAAAPGSARTIWGAQLEYGRSAGEYTPTTSAAYYGPRFDYNASACVYTSNLLVYSEDLSNAAWTASDTKNYVANTNIAPDGTMTAGTLSDTSASLYHGAYQSVTVPDDSATYSTSVYVLKTTGGTSKTVGINVSIVGGTSVAVNFRVNTDTGYSPTATVEDAGLYWRVKGSITNNTLGNTTLRFYLFPSTSDNGVYVDSAAAIGSAVLWGAQVQRSTSVLDYVKTIGFPQMKLDSTSPAPVARGLLMEEQRTNLCLLSENIGDATYSKNGVTVINNILFSPNGVRTAAVITNNPSTSNHYTFQSITYTAAATTISGFFKYINNQWMGLRLYDGTTVFFGSFDLLNGVVGSLTASTTSTMTHVGGGWYKCTVTATPVAAAGNVLIAINNADSTGPISYTGLGTEKIGAWGIQVEVGAFATSYIPTTSASVTRGAETAKISGTNFSSWFNPTAGTVVSNFVVPPLVPLTYPYVFRLGNASLTQRTQHWINGSGTARCFNYNAGSSVEISFGAVTSGQSVKTAVMYSSAGIRSSLNGGSVGSDAGVADYSLFTAIDIGGIPGSYILNSTISKLAYYPSAMTDAQLQNITT